MSEAVLTLWMSTPVTPLTLMSASSAVSISSEPGIYVALVCASGRGKCAIVQPIERSYDPLTGAANLDGQDIGKINVKEYRTKIARVAQGPTLYASNVHFKFLSGANQPKSEVTQGEIEEACHNAGILEFIQSLPVQAFARTFVASEASIH
ncbi:hypothetical protein BC835DRAFT_1413380 [Cytidiella melzeri]|nr:hypothetical protein BC835DRAFT_1413380 [Cytidiella melzeri]